MKITIVAVGKLKEKYLKDGIGEYAKRLGRYCTLELLEVEDEQAPESLSPAEEIAVKVREGDRLLRKVREGSLLAVLDLKGEKLSSEAFAARLESFFVSGKSHITFVIGGSLGLDEGLVRKADFRFSMSDLTFPHQLVRLILSEQLYRAFRIMKGEPYHK